MFWQIDSTDTSQIDFFKSQYIYIEKMQLSK